MSDTSNQGDNAGKPGDDAKSQPRVSLFGGRDRPRPSAPAAPGPAAPPPRRPRRFGLSSLSGLLSFALIGALTGFALFAWAMIEARKPGPLAADKIVVIAREDDGGPIGDQLEREGVIDSAIWFAAMTLVDGSRSALKRGEYAFKAGVSLRQVEAQLVAHKVVQHKLTIVEGLTSDQVVQRLRDDDVLIGDIKEPPREGSLFPDTYFFERGDTRQAELTRMAKAQAKAVDEIWAKRASDLPIKSPGELITLASMVEKETGKADERARVAGVFINRLRRHMKLESDPTIVYGLVFGKGTLGHPISRAELEEATPYNTYIISGLPPGPICNPGRAALEAVANPSTTKDVYFVADGTGGHAFAETLDQHLKNVARWRQIEKDAKDRLAPDAAPAPAGAPAAPAAKHGAVEPADPRLFGALALGAAPNSDAGGGALGAKLARFAEELRLREALLGPAGSLSATKVSGKTPEDLGVVVTGVNDSPTGAAFAEGDDAGASADSIARVPLSPAALADEKARIARYGDLASAETRVAGLDNPPPPRARIFDASEGTPLDPLRNRTYDLNYEKTVPPLN